MNILNLLIDDKEQVELSDIFLSEDNRQQISQLIKEQKYADELLKYDLPINNKVFLFGNSGCGKTTTAKAIATALKKPVYILNLSNIVSSKIGETGQNLKLIFDKASRDKAVLFLDEFDQIGKARGNDDKDVGEMRRLVNTIIQLIDYFPKNALLICASNHPQIIDIALMRRFQLKISFELPSDEVLNEYYDAILSHFPENLRSINRKFGISFAEAKDYAYTIIKGNIINQLEKTNNNA
jgi:ATPase central domain protein